MRCMKCGTVFTDGTICPHCGADSSVGADNTSAYEVKEETAGENVGGNTPVKIPEGFKPMSENDKKLFESVDKLVFFSAIFSAACNLKTGYDFLTGAAYKKLGIPPEDIYAFYGPSLKYLDKSTGIFSLLFAIICGVAAIAINKKKKYAGVMMLSVIAVSFIVTVTYNALLTSLFGAAFDPMVIASAGVKAVWFVLLLLYFKKFKDQYVN